MEKDNNQRVADQRDVIRDLQQKLSQAQDENEKKSIQLKINVAQAKLEELENEQANDVSTSTPVTEGKATWKEQRAKDLRQRIKRAMANRDRTKGDARAKWQEGINDMRRQLKKVLSEETPQNTKQFHNAITDGEYSDELDESMPQGYSKSQFLKKDIPEAIKVIEKELSFAKQHMKDERSAFALLRGDFEAIEHFAEMVKSNCKELGNFETKGMLSEAYKQTQAQWDSEVKFGLSRGHKKPKFKLGQDVNKGEVVAVSYGRFSETPLYTVKDKNNQEHDYYEEELKESVIKEGCMTRKFENMTNREVASYIFSHPHTKFASKMKECDDKEIMKAIRDMKKASEDAPVTNTSAVANPQGANSMYMKRPEPEELKDDYLKESVDSDIEEILDDVGEMYGQGAKRLLRDEIYHKNYLVTRDSFARYVKELSGKGYLSDFIEAILDKDTRAFDNIVKKVK